MKKKDVIIEKWETTKKNFPEIKGKEDVIKEKWEQLEFYSLKFIYSLIK